MFEKVQSCYSAVAQFGSESQLCWLSSSSSSSSCCCSYRVTLICDLCCQIVANYKNHKLWSFTHIFTFRCMSVPVSEICVLVTWVSVLGVIVYLTTVCHRIKLDLICIWLHEQLGLCFCTIRCQLFCKSIILVGLLSVNACKLMT